MTQLFFVLLYIALWRFAYMADKRNNKNIIIICCLVLALVGGLRGENVGIDTHFYFDAFNNNFPIPWQFKETGFRFISRGLMSFGPMSRFSTS